MIGIPFKRALFFLVTVGLILFALDSIIRILLHKCPVGNIAKVNAIMEHRLDVPITIWGASTARVHYDAELMERDLRESCFNMGLDGTPFHQYNGLLKEYISYAKRAKVLVLVIDINGFSRRNALYQSYAWLHHMSNINIFNSLEKIDSELCYKSRYIPLYYLTAYDRRFLSRCIKWIYYKTDVEPELDNKGFHASNVQWQQKGYEKNFDVVIDPNVLEEIKSVIDLSLKANIKVIVSVPPCYKEGLNFVLNINEFENKVNSLKREGVYVLNYLRSDLGNNKNNFYNNTHLNTTGAKNFTMRFIDDFKKLPLNLVIDYGSSKALRNIHEII